MSETVNILGLAIDAVSQAEALERAISLLCTREERPAHIVTANPEMLMIAQKDPSVAAIIAEAELVVADGMGVVWGSRILQRPLPDRVAGIDLTTSLLRQAAKRQKTVFLLGAHPGVAEEAATKLQSQHKGLYVVGTHHGYFDPSEEPDIVSTINATGADLLLVALGVPRQELWIARQRAQLHVNLMIGVGGALDVFAGRTRRAPRWTHELGLEWAYRLVMEPQRIGRMGALPRFAWAILKERYARRVHL